MLLRQCMIKNFGSYRELAFDFADTGLASVGGPTGSGKSTFCDAPYWILFGKTSKDSKVDEVKSWNTDEPIEGSQVVVLSDKTIVVTRKRGKPTENDLYYTTLTEPDKKIRGKDIPETQKLIALALGVDFDLYLMSSYFHEFSEAGRFFSADASERRKILEKVKDLSLPITLAESASDKRKEVKKDITNKELALSKLQGKLEQTEDTLDKAERAATDWSAERAKKLALLEVKRGEFNQANATEKETILSRLKFLEQSILDPSEFDGRTSQTKTQLNMLENLKSTKREVDRDVTKSTCSLEALQKQIESFYDLTHSNCPTCLQQIDTGLIAEHVENVALEIEAEGVRLAALLDRQEELRDALSAESKLRKGLEKIQKEKDDNQRLIEKYKHDEMLLLMNAGQKNLYTIQIKELNQLVNPYSDNTATLTTSIEILTQEFSVLTAQLNEAKHLLSSLNWTYDSSFVLRSMLLERAVASIEAATNKRFEKYFDSLLRVKFTLQNTDKLEVLITVNGNACSYERLSKGQRCLLKLCFWLSLRNAAENKAGIKLLNIMFDEALDGLDGTLKLAAFRMLQDMEADYKSILLIDHSETLQGEFENRYQVSLVGEESFLERVGEKA